MSDERQWVADLYDGDTFIGTVIVGDVPGAMTETMATYRERYRYVTYDDVTKRLRAVLEHRERLR